MEVEAQRSFATHGVGAHSLLSVLGVVEGVSHHHRQLLYAAIRGDFLHRFELVGLEEEVAVPVSVEVDYALVECSSGEVGCDHLNTDVLRSRVASLAFPRWVLAFPFVIPRAADFVALDDVCHHLINRHVDRAFSC